MDSIVSIIIPVYNVEKYIAQCIHSLKSQKYKRLDVILIDDGSIDNSAIIIEKLIKNDDRFSLVKKSNGGQASARNLGITLAKGDYVSFVDADDFVNENYILDFIKNNDKEYDLIISDYCTLDDKTNSIEIIKRDNYMLLDSNYYFSQYTNVWGKLYKKDLIKNIKFIEGLIYEDVAFSVEIFTKAKFINKTSSANYYYRIRADDSSTMQLNNDKIFDIYDILESLDNLVIEHEVLEYLYISHLILSGSQRFLNHDNGFDNIKNVVTYMNIKFPNWRNNKLINNDTLWHKKIFKLYSNPIWKIKILLKYDDLKNKLHRLRCKYIKE